MKRVLFVVLLFSTTGILFAGGKKEPVNDPGTASGEGRTIQVSYQINKTNPGSRSEGRNHILAVNGYVIPKAFDIIYAGDVYYSYKTTDQIWGDRGYVRDSDRSTPFSETSKKISDKDWALGWYEGSKHKEGTPRSWVYIEQGDLKAFINPDEIDRFIAFNF